MGPSEEVLTFPIPLENRGRVSLQNGVVFFSHGRWTISKISVPAMNIYHHQNSSKLN
jgi:hypothetical protein